MCNTSLSPAMCSSLKEKNMLLQGQISHYFLEILLKPAMMFMWFSTISTSSYMQTWNKLTIAAMQKLGSLCTNKLTPFSNQSSCISHFHQTVLAFTNASSYYCLVSSGKVKSIPSLSKLNCIFKSCRKRYVLSFCMLISCLRFNV